MSYSTAKTLPMNTENFNVALISCVRAATAAGVEDAGDLRWSSINMDQTWGDKVGVVLHGASDETNLRAAAWFHVWICRHRGAGGYNAQRSVSGEPKLAGFTKYTNGVSGWHLGEIEPYSEYDMEVGTKDAPRTFRMARVEEATGYAVSHSYYPCAE